MNGISISADWVMPMTFDDLVEWFCLSQEAFRSELARVGEGESVITNLGGHDNGKN